MTADAAMDAIKADLNKGRSVLVGYLLWFFLGVFGAHHFYLGDTRRALMMAALYWGSLIIMIVPIIGWIIGPIGVLAWFVWWVINGVKLKGLIEAANAAA